MSDERINIPYKGTPEQESQLAELLDDYKGTKSPLIPVLEQAQEIFGYLPEKVLKTISEELRISLAKIYGVVTFYSFFSLYPKGKYNISVCLGTACYVKGSGQVYEKLQKTLEEEGFENYFIGTVEAKPDLEDVTAALREKGIYKKVVLRPLMLVAGDHANNDMAGDEKDSWKMVLGSEGYEVECVLQGLGELESIRNLYVKHVRAAVESLKQP